MRGEGAPVSLTDAERSTHLHVLGASNAGKSRFLEYLIRQDVAAGQGLCLIDPHGHLFDRVKDWIALRGLGRVRTVRLFQPTLEGWGFGFNPLPKSSHGTSEIEYAVDAVVNTLASVWGGEDTRKTPRLRRCLKLTLYALAANDLTLAEAGIFTATADPDGLRRALTERIADPFIAQSWQDLNARPARVFAEEFESTNNRFFELLASSLIRRTVGTRSYALDTLRAMEEGDVLLVDLSDRGGQLSRAAAQTLGALLIGDFMLKARGRADGARPFHLYIDEAHRYLTPDILDVLFEARKFGLHLTLAHQSLSQLGPPDGLLYRGIMAGAQTKVLFRVGSFSDAQPVATETMVLEVDAQRVKESLPSYSTIGHERIWLRTESSTATTGHTQSESHVISAGEGRMSSEGESESSSTRFDAESRERGSSEGSTASSSSGTSTFYGEAVSSGSSTTQSYGETTGRAEALRPIIDRLYTQTYSLEEQIHEQAKELQSQKTGQAILRRPTGELERIEVPHVEDRDTRHRRVRAVIERFTKEVLENTPFSVPAEEIETEIATRQAVVIEGGESGQREPEHW